MSAGFLAPQNLEGSTAEDIESQGLRWPIEHNTASTSSDFARELFRVECSTRPVRKYHGNLKELVRDLAQLSQRQSRVIFVQSSLGRAERLYDILKEYDAACVADFKPEAREATLLRQIEHRIPTIVVGELLEGFEAEAGNLVLFGDHDLFDESESAGASGQVESEERFFHFGFSRAQALGLRGSHRPWNWPVSGSETDGV